MKTQYGVLLDGTITVLVEPGAPFTPLRRLPAAEPRATFAALAACGVGKT